MSDFYFTPDWPAPANVQTLITTRQGGISKPPYDGFNLGLHVGDEVAAVTHNRQMLSDTADDKLEFQWLKQVHGNKVLVLEQETVPESTEADAIFTRQPELACGVLTADCLSVFFCSEDGAEIAVAHAGWRGLASGVLENTIDKFEAEPKNLLVYLGPVIGPCHFEVGDEVKEAFLDMDLDEIFNQEDLLFQAGETKGKWMADLYALARIILSAKGLTQIYGEPLCTYCEFDRFYSYRRDGATGRFASLIWML